MQDLTSKMDEEEHLRKILLTIGYLSEHGEVPGMTNKSTIKFYSSSNHSLVHVFGPLFDEIRGELVAEQLHQKWLTDPNFAKIAPKIVHLLSDVS
jgi:hypothetical protein